MKYGYGGKLHVSIIRDKLFPKTALSRDARKDFMKQVADVQHNAFIHPLTHLDVYIYMYIENIQCNPIDELQVILYWCLIC